MTTISRHSGTKALATARASVAWARKAGMMTLTE
jgi:hypothetical protein